MAWSKAYSTNYSLIDWSDFKPAMPVKIKQETGSGPMFMPDIAPFLSPIDYSVVSSRSQLREHEKRYEVKQVGTDLKLADYGARPDHHNERAVERAYRTALEKKGLL